MTTDSRLARRARLAPSCGSDDSAKLAARCARCRRATSSGARSSRKGTRSGRAASARRSRSSTDRCTFSSRARIVRALPAADQAVTTIVDLGCGTGAAGVAWASPPARRACWVRSQPWAVDEATLDVSQFHLEGRAVRRELRRPTRPRSRSQSAPPPAPASSPPTRSTSSHRAAGRDAAHAARRASRRPRSRHRADCPADVALVERVADAFARTGGRADEWRFQAPLPPTQQQLAKAAGLDPARADGAVAPVIALCLCQRTAAGPGDGCDNLPPFGVGVLRRMPPSDGCSGSRQYHRRGGARALRRATACDAPFRFSRA